jgi:serine/threonine-protein kinase
LSLSPGSRLGRFEITALIGKGGMGEVYRASDTRLGREVALKVLPERLQRDEEYRQRLRREAESISQLQHANICALYDIGREDGIDFLVMELLDGETLEERLRRQRLSVREALEVAAKIAGALERAHRQGIVHRDLKPGNVMLTPDGPKVLDFGLAKEFVGGQTAAASGSPTVLMTSDSKIVGTLHYMAPEQLHGRPVDARTDIFALGCLLHEMLSGSRPFEGESQASLIAAILDHAPAPLEELVEDRPTGLQRVVERCLAKDAEQRWQSSGDVQALLEDLAAGEFSGEAAVAPVEAATASPASRRAAFIGAGVAVLALLAVAWVAGRSMTSGSSAAPPVERHVIDVTGAEELGELSNPVLSRDGTKMAFVANSAAGLQLYLRRFDELEARPVDGTGNAGWATFSPDGEWLLFFDVVDRRLKKVSIHGGTAIDVVVPSYLPASWESDGYIYYSPLSHGRPGTPDSKGLWRIAAEGGEPERLSRAEPRPGTPRHLGHYAPQLLPDGRRLLFSVGDGYLRSEWNVAVLDLGTGRWKTVFKGAYQPTVVAEHLVFWRDNRLWAAPFDLEGLQTLAAPQPVLEGVARHPLAPIEVGQYRVTDQGDLVYVGGTSTTQELARMVAAPFEGDEVVLHSAVNERLYGPRLSPGGRRLAFERCAGGEEDFACQIWVVDMRDGSLSQLSEDGVSAFTVLWEATQEAVIYTAVGDTTIRLMRQSLDGTLPTVLMESQSGARLAAQASLRDGRLIVVSGPRRFEQGIRVLSPDGSVDVLVEEGWQMVTDLSPDDRWLIFHGDRSGQFELYTLDLESTQPRPRRLTTDGAMFGRFAPDGRSLYMRSRTYPGPAEILRAPFDPATGQLGSTERVMSTPAQGFTSGWWLLGQFEVTDDALIMAQLQTPPRSGRIVLVRNWAREMAERLR